MRVPEIVFDMNLGEVKQSRWAGALYSIASMKRKMSGAEGRPPNMMMRVLSTDILINSA